MSRSYQTVTNVFVNQIAAPDDTFEVKICVEEAAVIVTATKEPTSECTITFTSPVMRDDATEGGKRRGNLPQRANPSLSCHTKPSEEHTFMSPYTPCPNWFHS